MSARSLKRAHRREHEKSRRRAKRLTLAGGAVGAALMAAPAAQAANFEVKNLTDAGDNTCDATCTLRDAVDDANNSAGGDTITFQSGLTGQITLTEGAIEISGNQDLMMTGPGASAVSVSGDYNNSNTVDFEDNVDPGDSRIFEIAGYGYLVQSVTIADLTLTEGVASYYYYNSYTMDGYYEAEDGGAIAAENVNLTITDSALTGNLATASGGAVSAEGLGSLTIDDSTVSDNAAYDDGGGAYTALTSSYYSSGLTSVNDSTFSGNYAGGTSALFSQYAYPSGGGLNVDGENTTLTDTTFDDNTASRTSIGPYGNYVYGEGGALAVRDYNDYTTESSGLTISDNFAGRDAGGASLIGGGIWLEDSTVTGNNAGDDAGGLDLVEGAQAVEVVVADNTASDSGGGVRMDEEARLVSSTVSGNDAETGGGVAAGGEASPARIVNSTVSGNAADEGGGIFSTGPSALELFNSTVADNSAIDGGGISAFTYAPPDSGEAPMLVRNSLVANNTASGNGPDTYADTYIATGDDMIVASFSLFESPAAGNVRSEFAGSNVFGADPNLGSLADNGGPTDTHLPAPNSEAIDAANAGPLVHDQRGQDRTVDAAAPNEPLTDGTDMGSVEVQSAAAPGDPDPETTINSGPTGTQTSTSASFAFTSNVSGATFECSLDGGAWAACTSPKAYSGLSAGQHAFSVRAKDSAGNVDNSPATRAFTVDPAGPADEVDPDTRITNDPPAKVKAKKKKGKITFEFAGTDNQTAANALTFECSLDGATFAACTSPLTVKAKKGDHLFQVRAVDEAGNVDRNPASHRFTVKKKKKKKK